MGEEVKWVAWEKYDRGGEGESEGDGEGGEEENEKKEEKKEKENAAGETTVV